MVAANRRKSDTPQEVASVRPTKIAKIPADHLTGDDVMCVNTIRCLGADLPQAANSGHPGAPMDDAPIAHLLFGHVMKFHGKHPHWINRDRFVLSNGHACALLYSMLHLSGYNVSIDDLKKFRKLGSNTPGHPERLETPGVEVTTGPLGQGIANAVGMAIGLQHLAAKFNTKAFPIFDQHVYCICGDGCLQEGVASEACSLAGHLGTNRLIVLYDSNKITIDGATDVSFTENVCERFRSYGWHTLHVENGDTDLQSILNAINEAKKKTDRPTLIEVRTTIGYGSLNAGSEKTHGSPLGVDDIRQLKTKFGLNPDESFQVPDAVQKFYAGVRERNENAHTAWQNRFKQYAVAHPVLHAELVRRMANKIDPKVFQDLKEIAKTFSTQTLATRALSGKALNAIKEHLPELIGGSADLMTSNSCALVGEKAMTPHDFSARYIHFGVREHGMAAIANGLFSLEVFRPFTATFMNFVTYAWGAVRLSALSHMGVLYIATHDTIELGEDGPTHQPVEVFSLLRTTPNLYLIRPADANEVAGAYKVWLEHPTTPCVMSLCRGNIPPIANSSLEGVAMGAYVIHDFEKKDGKQVVIASCGSELHLCVRARELLLERDLSVDVRIVSMPSWDLFEEQSEEYRHSTLCTAARAKGTCVTAYVEPSIAFGWDKYFDVHVSMKSFGASGKKDALYEKFGFTPENIADMIQARVKA